MLVLSVLNGEHGKCKILSYVKNCDKLSELLMGMDSFDIDDVRSIKDFLNNMKGWYKLNAKYSLAVLSDNQKSIGLNSASLDVEEFRGLKGHSGIVIAGLHELKLTRNGVEISKEEFTSVFTEIVGSWKQVEKVDCCNTNLLNLDFIRDKEKEITNTPNLIALSILGTSIVDLDNIRYVKLECLGINNSNINLKLIENYIGNMRIYVNYTRFLGIIFAELLRCLINLEL